MIPKQEKENVENDINYLFNKYINKHIKSAVVSVYDRNYKKAIKDIVVELAVFGFNDNDKEKYEHIKKFYTQYCC